MSDLSPGRIANPIVEAVLDIDCDMPPSQTPASLEAPVRECFREQYPNFRPVLVEQHQFEQQGDAPPTFSKHRGVQAFQFLKEDGKQLIQLRADGFSFNRLAPYSSLDDYLPEIERTWKLFCHVVKPIQIRMIRLRHINRILLPLAGGNVELSEYLVLCPKLPDETALSFVNVLNHYVALERDSSNVVNIILTSQQAEVGRLPIIFDIEAVREGFIDPVDWPEVLSRIQSLRSLNNRVFENTLTERCLKLFHTQTPA